MAIRREESTGRSHEDLVSADRGGGVTEPAGGSRRTPRSPECRPREGWIRGRRVVYTLSPLVRPARPSPTPRSRPTSPSGASRSRKSAPDEGTARRFRNAMITLASLLVLLAQAPAPSAGGFPFFEPVQPSRALEVVAHRVGSGLAPEDTARALEASIADTVEWAEVTVRRTRDGHHVLYPRRRTRRPDRRDRARARPHPRGSPLRRRGCQVRPSVRRRTDPDPGGRAAARPGTDQPAPRLQGRRSRPARPRGARGGDGTPGGRLCESRRAPRGPRRRRRGRGPDGGVAAGLRDDDDGSRTSARTRSRSTPPT